MLDKLRSYYIDDCPLICRRHAFTACRQEHGEPFLTWWERKMIKAQEGMIDSMTVDNWLELELIRGVNDQNLKKKNPPGAQPHVARYGQHCHAMAIS